MRDLRAATDEELLRITPRHPRAFDEFYVRHEGELLGTSGAVRTRRRSRST